jgi:hypothetical protein
MSLIALLLLVATVTPVPPATEDPLARIAVIGASASAGWGVVVASDPSGDPVPIHHTHVDLADVLPVVLSGASPVMSRHADLSFFANPGNVGRVEMDAALAAEPTLIVAVDYLFWYGYGARPDSSRMAMLERGLRELDRATVPILVGDIPDVSTAAEAEPIALISTRQVPTEPTLIALNARIHEWAAARPRVHVVPLAEVVSQWQRGIPPDLNGHAWPADCSLVQFDQLHPTAAGLIALTELVAATIRDHITPVKVQADPAIVLATLSASATSVAP